MISTLVLGECLYKNMPWLWSDINMCGTHVAECMKDDMALMGCIHEGIDIIALGYPTSAYNDYNVKNDIEIKYFRPGDQKNDILGWVTT